MSVETFSTVECRFAIDDTGKIMGTAAVWDTRCAYGDFVQRGAFANSLTEHRQAGTRPLMLMSHDPGRVIGRWDDVREDDSGLQVTGQIVKECTAGADAYALLKAGAMNGLSIGFNTVRSDRRTDGRNVREVKLHEISIVGRPAQPLARVTGVRHIAGQIDQAAAAGLAAYIRRCGDRLKGSA